MPCRFGVSGSQISFRRIEGIPVELLGNHVFPLMLQCQGDPSQGTDRIGMAPSQSLLTDGQRPAHNALRLRALSLAVQRDTEVLQTIGGYGVTRAVRLLVYRQGVAIQRLGFPISALARQCQSDVILDLRG